MSQDEVSPEKQKKDLIKENKEYILKMNFINKKDSFKILLKNVKELDKEEFIFLKELIILYKEDQIKNYKNNSKEEYESLSMLLEDLNNEEKIHLIVNE